MKMLNVGCGSRFHSAWENLDFVPTDASVRPCDLRKGIPFSDGVFDVVYHSHVLEHFPKQVAPEFLRECIRVLKSGGVIRVAVPDLEQIARLYLEAFDKASQRLHGWDHNYDWMVLEMYDQAVRDKSGGECAEYFRQSLVSNQEFVIQRMGTWAQFLEETKQDECSCRSEGDARARKSWLQSVRHLRAAVRDKWTRAVLGSEDWDCLQKGRFRSSGENHMWMYDSYSLGRLLTAVGFRDPRRQTATQSQIPQWEQFHLDTEPDGRVYKADSLYMEATKP